MSEGNSSDTLQASVRKAGSEKSASLRDATLRDIPMPRHGKGDTCGGVVKGMTGAMVLQETQCSPNICHGTLLPRQPSLCLLRFHIDGLDSSVVVIKQDGVTRTLSEGCCLVVRGKSP